MKRLMEQDLAWLKGGGGFNTNRMCEKQGFDCSEQCPYYEIMCKEGCVKSLPIGIQIEELSWMINGGCHG